jgi:hypothetical protein
MWIRWRSRLLKYLSVAILAFKTKAIALQVRLQTYVLLSPCSVGFLDNAEIEAEIPNTRISIAPSDALNAKYLEFPNSNR